MRTARTLAVAMALTMAAAAALSAGRPQEPQGSSDGIKVHGDWTIELTNPDGTSGGRYQFKNALQESGGQVLAHLLGATLGSPTTARGSWIVELGTNSAAPHGVSGGPCDGPAPCILVEQDTLPHDALITVTSTQVLPGHAADAIRLNGSVVATQNADIGFVLTRQYIPGFTAVTGQVFSLKALASPIHVVVGQTVAVTVVISFS
jgi:hypothetical protein